MALVSFRKAAWGFRKWFIFNEGFLLPPRKITRKLASKKEREQNLNNLQGNEKAHKFKVKLCRLFQRLWHHRVYKIMENTLKK